MAILGLILKIIVGLSSTLSIATQFTKTVFIN